MLIAAFWEDGVIDSVCIPFKCAVMLRIHQLLRRTGDYEPVITNRDTNRKLFVCYPHGPAKQARMQSRWGLDSNEQTRRFEYGKVIKRHNSTRVLESFPGKST